MKKKYLLHENADVATQHLASINEVLVKPINDLIEALRNAGAQIASMDDVKDIVENGIDAIEALIPAIDKASIPAGLEAVAEKERQDHIQKAWNCFIALDDVQIYDGTPITENEVIPMLEMDSTGFVVLSDSAIERIKEEPKEYISTPIGCELYELQHQLAELLQRFHDKLSEANNLPNKTMSLDAKVALYRLFPLGAFRFTRDVEDNLTILPKVINFDPVDNDDADMI